MQADMGNHLVRYANVSSGSTSTLAGTAGSSGFANGIWTAASFNGLTQAVIDATGAFVLVVSTMAMNAA